MIDNPAEAHADIPDSAEEKAPKATKKAAKTAAKRSVKRAAKPKAKSERAVKRRKSKVVEVDETTEALRKERRESGIWIGAHFSMAGGFENAVHKAASIGAVAIAMDTRSKRKWESPPITEEQVTLFQTACKRFHFDQRHILPHGSYLINCGSPDPDMLEKSRGALLDEVRRCEQLGLTLYNFHPGSTVGKCEVKDCLARIADSLNYVHKRTTGVITVLENMAGQGNVVGGPFEHLAAIISDVDDKSRVGVCIDTCHAFSAGHDMRTPETFAAMMENFDRIVGLKYLRGIHLNDSKTELGGKKDRHENIGKGHIGEEGFQALVNDPRLKNIPMILETPPPKSGDSDALFGSEIDLLYSWVQKEDPKTAPQEK